MKPGRENVVLFLCWNKDDTEHRQEAGLRRFVKAAGWTLVTKRVSTKAAYAALPQVVRRVAPIGIVSSIRYPVTREVSGGVPVVFFDCDISLVTRGAPHLRHDATVTTHLATAELLSLGYDHYAYVARFGGGYWSDERGKVFRREIEKRGGRLVGEFHAFRLPHAREMRELGEWLCALPKPCGIFAANDAVAEQVLKACALNRISVPDEIAVVGVDDNPKICPRTVPTLTSVVPDWEAGAFIAANVLRDLIRGKRVQELRQTFRPLGLVRRESTSRTGRDPRILAAIDRIRAEACAGLKAEEVIAGMGCSRRLAELRFRETVGRSVLEEIRRVRIETACAALSDTENTLSSVANSCGWASIPTFCHDFKRATGLTPEGWRRKSR